MHTSKILFTSFVTHDVKHFMVEKPRGYQFTPGQATDVAINQSEWREERRPFTFTSLNDDLVLEFTIKGYFDHAGVTQKLHSLVPGDELLLDEPWGTITYRGPGTFIAGGAGITPFIAIFRQLRKEDKIEGNRLIYSNKTRKDVILEKELRETFGENLTLLVTREDVPEDCGYEKGRIDREYLEASIPTLSSQTRLRGASMNLEQNFYVCGPKPMVKDVKGYLEELGVKADSVVFEK